MPTRPVPTRPLRTRPLRTPGDIATHARAAGIRSSAALDLASVERRRRQLWLVMGGVLLAVSTAVALTAIAPDVVARSSVSPRALQIAMPLVSLGFLAYLFEKEGDLRRVTEILLAERERLSLQAHQLRAALEAGRAISASLELDDVAESVLASGLLLSNGESGSLVLAGDHGLVVHHADGPEHHDPHFDPDAAERAADTRHVVVRQAEGDRPAGFCLPMIHSDHLAGVLCVTLRPGQAIDDDTLALLDGLAEHAALALTNARQFDATRTDSERLRAVESARHEFAWLNRAGA